ncbi:sigma-54 dependent transcriptional regulator [Prosthecochloris sp.]|uniref:sigma-54-dependent transcriptional regulator n=1 Tax=Prosthecochloris sp. TaxID=290513 RepID=UPI00257AE36C|nr:sigma-54 dependent transcriptional regulator [Prosthecochloris sp.]
MTHKILVVDDETRYRGLYRQVLESVGFSTLKATCVKEALEIIQNEPPSLIISDVRMPDASGLELLRTTREKHIALPFLLVTAYADVNEAVKAMKLGAVDYLSKPVDLDELVTAVQDALSIKAAKPEIIIPQEKLDGVIAYSSAMLNILHDAYRIAASDANVLIMGESGVGKEVLSHFIHKCSPRHNRPMVAVNCAAIPSTLLASEMFGHEKGSFTGAEKKRQGRFREVSGGTLLLDEIGDMPLELQPAFLRTIETGRIVPIGSDKEIAVNFRLLAATNRNLVQDVKQGRFRKDLYYRLNVIAITIPPLRERKEDILPLARFFLNRGHSETKRLSREASNILGSYHWPGNVRELANAMEHARLLCQTDIIVPEHLPPTIRNFIASHTEETTQKAVPEKKIIKTLEEIEIESIKQALELSGGNRTRAAKLLGITRRGFIYKLKRFGMT